MKPLLDKVEMVADRFKRDQQYNNSEDFIHSKESYMSLKSIFTQFKTNQNLLVKILFRKIYK